MDAANARRQSLSLEATPSTAATSGGRPFLYVLNLVRTKHIANVKRGARTKAMAICTQHQFLHVYKVRPLPAADGGSRGSRRRAVASPIGDCMVPGCTCDLAAAPAHRPGSFFRHADREVRHWFQARSALIKQLNRGLGGTDDPGARELVSILQELYQAVNQMDLSGLPVLTQQEKRIIRASDQEKR